jgi:hypothetical protein
MPKQIATARMEGIRKRGRPRQKWKDEVEEDLSVPCIWKGQAMVRPLGMEEGCTGSQVPQQTVVPEENE